MNLVTRLAPVPVALLLLSACSNPSIHVDPRAPVTSFIPADSGPGVERAPVGRIRVVTPEPAPIRTKP